MGSSELRSLIFTTNKQPELVLNSCVPILTELLAVLLNKEISRVGGNNIGKIISHDGKKQSYIVIAWSRSSLSFCTYSFRQRRGVLRSVATQSTLGRKCEYEQTKLCTVGHCLGHCCCVCCCCFWNGECYSAAKRYVRVLISIVCHVKNNQNFDFFYDGDNSWL